MTPRHPILARPATLAAALLSLALFTLPAAEAAEVGGVQVPDTAKVAGKDLKLNGAGLRTRAMFKVYAMGLYLGEKKTDAAGAIAAPGPKRMTLHMLREISGEDFGQAFMTGINNNTDKAEKTKIVNQMVKLGEMFVAVGGLKKGDQIVIDWVPEKGTVIELNGKNPIEPLPDAAFYTALMKIWLGDKPADSALKPALLGGKAE